jgi:hypothetical protein
MNGYYLDTCVWIDYIENRRGLRGKPLGEIASRLFLKMMREHITIFYSEKIADELIGLG